jgi:hypothetical protein
MLTLSELGRMLRQYDVEQVCEMLDITSEEIIERFLDLLEERQDFIRKELDADDEDDEFDQDAEY